jgi:hypothetical protein
MEAGTSLADEIRTPKQKRKSSTPATTPATSRRRRSKTITANNIESIDADICLLQPMTEGSYASYRNPFITWAIQCGLTSQHYADAIETSENFTTDYLDQRKIFPICSSENINRYMKDVYFKEGRRRGTGVPSRSMART